MDTRERFLKTWNYESVDRVPDFEFGYWDECYEVWRQQGLPDGLNNIWDLERYFGFEYYHTITINSGICPGFESKVLEVIGDHQIVQGGDGVIYEESLTSRSIPKYIKFPIETRDDWKRFRDEQLNPDTVGRVPDNIDEIVAYHKDRDYPLGVWCGSLYGMLRNWMGVENISIAIGLDRDWVEEMIEHITELSLKMLSKVMGKIEFDFGNWWEDMCFNHGPLVSPAFFNEVMVPRYKRITSYLAEYGIKYHVLDCDGNITKLVPGWLDAGINVMFPVESAHTDQAALRKEYGKQVRFMGGVNKMQLIKGKEAIDEEIQRIAKLMEDGGFIPHVDHRCPPDVTLENYRYYIKKKRELIGRTD